MGALEEEDVTIVFSFLSIKHVGVGLEEEEELNNCEGGWNGPASFYKASLNDRNPSLNLVRVRDGEYFKYIKTKARKPHE